MKVTQNIVNNYLVPASGQTHCVQLSGVLTAANYVMDWGQFKVDNFAFIPQGVFIDNTQGAGDVTIVIQPLNYSVVCPAGASGQFQFPAGRDQVWNITGDGQAAIFAVDFPVMPNGQLVSLANTANVNIEGADNAASPVFTMPPNLPGGLPYYVQKQVLPATVEYLSTTGAPVNVAPGNLNLRKLKVTVSGDAILAAAGRTTITVTLNGVNVFKVSVYLPTAIPANPQTQQFDVAFDDAAWTAGAGTITIQASTALTGGLIEMNAYFA